MTLLLPSLSACALLAASLAPPASPGPAPMPAPAPALPRAAAPSDDAALAAAVADNLLRDVRTLPRTAAELDALALLRADVAAAREVSDALAAQGTHGTFISAAAGTLELHGELADEAAIEKAVRTAREHSGGRPVIDSLGVAGEPSRARGTDGGPAGGARPLPPGAVPDPPAARAASPAAVLGVAFLTDDGLAGRDITVAAHDGIVTLEGRVNGDLARRYASLAAQRAPGARVVFNHLEVRSTDVVAERRLALLVQRRLEYSAIVQDVAPAIVVSSNEGVVRLEGRVRDAEQLLEAVRLAAGTRTVFAVDNRLEVDADLVILRRPPSQALQIRPPS